MRILRQKRPELGTRTSKRVGNKTPRPEFHGESDSEVKIEEFLQFTLVFVETAVTSSPDVLSRRKIAEIEALETILLILTLPGPKNHQKPPKT